jgi:tellurite resistance protein
MPKPPLSAPPVFPLRPPKPPGRFRQVPPAIFPPILGLLALGLAWRRGAEVFGLPAGLAEMLLGAVSLLWAAAVFAYAAKLVQRPSVLAEDVAILPGQGGCSALAMTFSAVALALVPHAPGLATGLMVAGLLAHLVIALLVVRALLAAPPEGRMVTPVWHLTFVGYIVAALPALELGFTSLAWALFGFALPVALVLWGLSLRQIMSRIPPAPLRPLLAIHLAPAALLGTVAYALGLGMIAQGFAVVSVAILIALVASARWLTVAGFSPFWSAFTFPLAALATFLIVLGGAWRVPGGLLLVAATLLILPVAVKILQLWIKGTLGPRSNAAIA